MKNNLIKKIGKGIVKKGLGLATAVTLGVGGLAGVGYASDCKTWENKDGLPTMSICVDYDDKGEINYVNQIIFKDGKRNVERTDYNGDGTWDEEFKYGGKKK